MKLIVLTSLAFTVLIGSHASGQTITPTSSVIMPLRLSVRPDSRLWLEGSSNLRDWRCEATSLDASVDVDDDAHTASAVDRLRHVQVRVPTHALTCGRSQMDHIMYKALHVDDEPDCRQILGRFDVVSREPDGSLVMEGTLRIAGRERVVRLPVVVQQQPGGALRAQGTLPILMTDYGVTPPTALFGVLRTENRIVVKFDLVVDQSTTLASIGER
jgi:polyisoprenoid-binding protein YceI